MNSVCDKGGGGKKIRKFFGRHISIAPNKGGNTSPLPPYCVHAARLNEEMDAG